MVKYIPHSCAKQVSIHARRAVDIMVNTKAKQIWWLLPRWTRGIGTWAGETLGKRAILSPLADNNNYTTHNLSWV